MGKLSLFMKLSVAMARPVNLAMLMVGWGLENCPMVLQFRPFQRRDDLSAFQSKGEQGGHTGRPTQELHSRRTSRKTANLRQRTYDRLSVLHVPCTGQAPQYGWDAAIINYRAVGMRQKHNSITVFASESRSCVS